MFPVIKTRPFGTPYFGIDQFFNDIPVKEFLNSSLRSGFSTPAANIKESETQFVIELAAPGFSKGEFDVKIEDKTLRISAEKKSEKDSTNERFTRKEFSYEKFTRLFNLPESINLSGISAEYLEGILHVTLPKKTEEVNDKAQLIEVK
ncbi:MAG: Hsp20/alpha crystallin family protein [Flavobacteriales bacterium]